MLGRTHATSGVAVALATIPALTSLGVAGNAWSVPLVVAAAAGGAMMPDFDHRHATIAKSLWPFTVGLAILVEKISGGHRNGTHSLVGLATGVLVTWGMVTVGGIVAGVWCGFLFAVGLAGLQLRFSKRSLWVHTLVSLLVGVGMVGLAASAVPLDLVVWGFGIGYAAHLLGDMLTRQGVPLLYPFNRTRFKVANFTTGQFFETYILSPLLGVLIVAEVVWLVAGGWLPAASMVLPGT